MAVKNANVIARVEPEIKEQAEQILSEMGISTSAAINMFYRQIIMCEGLPFRPSRRPISRDEMTDEGIHRMEAAMKGDVYAMLIEHLQQIIRAGLNQLQMNTGISLGIGSQNRRQDIRVKIM